MRNVIQFKPNPDWKHQIPSQSHNKRTLKNSPLPLKYEINALVKKYKLSFGILRLFEITDPMVNSSNTQDSQAS